MNIRTIEEYDEMTLIDVYEIFVNITEKLIETDKPIYAKELLKIKESIDKRKVAWKTRHI